MPHFIHRSWLVAGVVVVAALVCAAAAMRWALDPFLLKTLAQSRLSAALGQPVRIGTVRLSFFPPLTVYGTDIAIGEGARGGGASLDMRAIRMHPRLSSILSRPTVIDRVDIEGLALHARRDASGRWILPLPTGSISANDENARTARFDVAEVTLKSGQLTITEDHPAGRGASAITTPIDNINATVHRAGGVTQLDGLTASVGRSKVAGNGSVGRDGLRLTLRWTDLKAADMPLVFALLGSSAPPGLSVEGKNPLALDLRVGPNGEVSASGRIAADRAALGTLAMTSFQSPVGFASNRLTLDPMTFRAYSGSGRGRLTANLNSSPLAWTLDAEVQRLDIDQFLSANTTAKNKVSGTGSLEARLRGTSRAPIERTVAGAVAVNIANGAIRDFPLLSAIYSALRIGAGGDRDLHFQTLSATFAIADAQATTTDLVARTGELTLGAAGTIGFDQSIAMKGTAAFSPARSAEFVRSVRELSALRNPSGEIEVLFTISGSAAAPRFSIDVLGMARRGVERELERRLKERLNDLFKKIK